MHVRGNKGAVERQPQPDIHFRDPGRVDLFVHDTYCFRHEERFSRIEYGRIRLRRVIKLTCWRIRPWRTPSAYRFPQTHSSPCAPVAFEVHHTPSIACGLCHPTIHLPAPITPRIEACPTSVQVAICYTAEWESRRACACSQQRCRPTARSQLAHLRCASRL